MAVLHFKGDVLTVKATHNVLSEVSKLNNVNYVDVLKLPQTDPVGWIRDVLYCSLIIYTPDKLNGMSRWDVGDELFSLDSKVIQKFSLDIMDDFMVTMGVKTDKDKVASEKK